MNTLKTWPCTAILCPFWIRIRSPHLWTDARYTSNLTPSAATSSILLPVEPEFYAPYDKRNYALCFSCHEEAAFSTPQTTTLTSFRNGARNLHYVHLQQGSRGRTCRACHEVHASRQEHHIREGVPYGSGGWVLRLNYRRTEGGGSCEKTCHQQKGYDRASR